MSSHVSKYLLAGAPLAAIFFLTPRDATWKADSGDGIYDNASNWSSGSVPDGTAFFGASTEVTSHSAEDILPDTTGQTICSCPAKVGFP